MTEDKVVKSVRVDTLLVDLVKEYNELTYSLFGTKQNFSSLIMDAIPSLLESSISFYKGSLDEDDILTYIGDDGRKRRLKLTKEQLEKLDDVENFVYSYEQIRYEAHQ